MMCTRRRDRVSGKIVDRETPSNVHGDQVRLRVGTLEER